MMYIISFSHGGLFCAYILYPIDTGRPMKTNSKRNTGPFKTKIVMLTETVTETKEIEENSVTLVRARVYNLNLATPPVR